MRAGRLSVNITAVDMHVKKLMSVASSIEEMRSEDFELPVCAGNVSDSVRELYTDIYISAVLTRQLIEKSADLLQSIATIYAEAEKSISTAVSGQP